MITYAVFTERSTSDSNAPAKPGVAVSSTNTYYSDPVSARLGHLNGDGYGAHFWWTGTPTGTLTCWISDKEQPDRTSDADWVQDSGFSPTNPAGSASAFHDDVENTRARWKRFKYVNASGSGVLYCVVTAQ